MKQRSLVNEVMFPLVFVSFAIGLAVLLFLPNQVENNIRDRLVQELSTTGDAVALAIRVALIEEDLEALAQISSQLENHPYIAMAQVSIVDSDGFSTVSEFPYGINFAALLASERSRFSVVDTPLEGSGVSGQVSIAIDENAIDGAVAEYRMPIYVVFFALCLAQLFVFRQVRVRLLAPIQQVSDWAGTLSLDHQPELSIVTVRDDEIGVLQRTLIDMSQRLTDERSKNQSLMGSLESAVEVKTRELESTRQELNRAERNKMVGRLAGGIAHDFNNLLAAVEGNLRFAARSQKWDAVDGDTREALNDALESVHAGIRLNARLIQFSEGLGGAAYTVSLGSVLGEFEGSLDEETRARIELGFSSSDDVQVVVNKEEFLGVLDGLVANAIEASSGNGLIRVFVALSSSTTTSSSNIQIAVEDEGCGMSEEILARCADPFFSTKGVGAGRGLGLFQVFRFAESTGGTCVIDSAPGEGTKVRLILPVAAEATAAHFPDIDALPAKGDSCVLLVDDDEKSRRAMARLVHLTGVEVIECAGAGEALAKLVSVRSRLCGVISDVVMPNGVDGFRLKQELEKLVPGVPVLLVSGFDFSPASTRSPVIKKPLDLASVQQAFFAAG